MSMSNMRTAPAPPTSPSKILEDAQQGKFRMTKPVDGTAKPNLYEFEVDNEEMVGSGHGYVLTFIYYAPVQANKT